MQGTWRFVDHNGTARPGLGRVVKVWDADSTNEGTDRVSEGMTDIWSTFQNSNDYGFTP